MKLRWTALLAGAALIATVALTAELARAAEPGPSNPFVTTVTARSITAPGRIISTSATKLVLRIDDGHHRIPFMLGPGVKIDKLRRGTHVVVRYHPAGATGQIADEVTVG